MEYRYSNRWLYWSIGGFLLVLALLNQNWIYAALGIGAIALGFKRNKEDYL